TERRLGRQLHRKREAGGLSRRQDRREGPLRKGVRTALFSCRAMPWLDTDEGRAGLRPQRKVRQVVEAETQRRAVFGLVGKPLARAVREDHRVLLEQRMVEDQPAGLKGRWQLPRRKEAAIQPQQRRLAAIVEADHMGAA